MARRSLALASFIPTSRTTTSSSTNSFRSTRKPSTNWRKWVSELTQVLPAAGPAPAGLASPFEIRFLQAFHDHFRWRREPTASAVSAKYQYDLRRRQGAEECQLRGPAGRGALSCR